MQIYSIRFMSKYGWDLRVSSRLYDGSGSIKMILTKDIASRILQKNLSELILLATQANRTIPCNGNQFQTSVCSIKIPDSIEIIEAVTEDLSSSHRKNGKLIVTDGRNLVFLPSNEEHNFTELTTRQLQASNIEDKKIIRRLIERALEISIKKVTGKSCCTEYSFLKILFLYTDVRRHDYIWDFLSVSI